MSEALSTARAKQLFDEEAERDLRAWGRYNKKNLYEERAPTCIIGMLQKYGLRLGPVHYEQSVCFDNPAVDQVDKVYQFMPEKMRVALFLYYSVTKNKTWCVTRLKRLNAENPELPTIDSRQAFDYWLAKGRETYAASRHIDFSSI